MYGFLRLHVWMFAHLKYRMYGDVKNGPVLTKITKLNKNVTLKLLNVLMLIIDSVYFFDKEIKKSLFFHLSKLFVRN